MLIYGVYSAMNEGISKAWLSHSIPSHLRATGLGLFQMLTTLSLLVASPLAGALWTMLGASMPFFVTAAAALIVAMYFLLLKEK